VGYGYWGPNLVRNFAEVPDARVLAVSDLNSERLALVRKRYPAVKATSDYHELFADPEIDAIVVATPVCTHFELGMQALRAGKHLLMEKPMAATSEQAVRLIEEAEKRGSVLMVDHTFVYTGAVRKIRDLLAANSLGEIYYYDSVRINLGLFQHDVSVLWDLAVHDLSIMDAVLTEKPYAVSATGMCHVQGQPQNIAYLTLLFDSKLMAHFHVNWMAPVKVRKTLIGASHKMIVYDDLEPSEKVKVYDKGITVSNGNQSEARFQMLVGYRTGDMWAPKLDTKEALYYEAVHFVRCVQGLDQAMTDGAAGLRVVRILEAATESMNERGRLVELACAKRATPWSHS
jgi:predicted dehydrogenase